jgi:hypothetical protein
MPHQHPDRPDAPPQNRVGERQAPNDVARDDHRGVRPEPRTYAAPDVADATLAPPAAGEIPDYLDEGEPLSDAFGETQQGADRTLREVHRHRTSQGPKTTRAKRQIINKGANQ